MLCFALQTSNSSIQSENLFISLPLPAARLEEGSSPELDRAVFFSHLDSNCWSLLNSFLFDLISLSVSLRAISLLLFPPFPGSLYLFAFYWMSYCEPPAGKERPLSHTGPITKGEIFFLVSVSVCLCVSPPPVVLSAHCESRTVLSHASPLSPSSAVPLASSLDRWQRDCANWIFGNRAEACHKSTAQNSGLGVKPGSGTHSAAIFACCHRFSSSFLTPVLSTRVLPRTQCSSPRRRRVVFTQRIQVQRRWGKKSFSLTRFCGSVNRYVLSSCIKRWKRGSRAHSGCVHQHVWNLKPWEPKQCFGGCQSLSVGTGSPQDVAVH